MHGRIFILIILWIVCANSAFAFKVISPEPFFIVNKQYIKLQILKEKDDPTPDSVLFELTYNDGKKFTVRADKSLSAVVSVSEFNDGGVYVLSRVYVDGQELIISSEYGPNGIPVMLDRNFTYNPLTIKSHYRPNKRKREIFFTNQPENHFDGNNNQIAFSSCWDFDSLYLVVIVKDKQLNYNQPYSSDLFQKKDYLKVLWGSDCLEIGLDLMHNRSVWKQQDDHEIIVDIKGNTIGYQWCAQDSFYRYWGKDSRITVNRLGSINNNYDTDTGYSAFFAISWKELAFRPKKGMAIGFDIQDYDKDGGSDEAFRTSLSGTNPESNDNTSEWATLLLVSDGHSFRAWIFIVFVSSLLSLLFSWYFRKKRKSKTENPRPLTYSQSIEKALVFIQNNFNDPALSREKIAHHVNLTEKYLSTLFKKEIGTNLIGYINIVRITDAERLLKETNLTVSEIAFRVGYNSIQNFNKNFRSITHKAPTDFR